MKKIICIIAVVLLIASVVGAQKKATKITPKDLPGMKGTWSGVLTFGQLTEWGSSPATLEILNDSVPVKTKLTIENMPTALTQLLGLWSGTNIFDEADGVINTKGTVLCTGPMGFFEITKSADKDFMVTYWYRGLKGDGIFSKK
jgi:hypothetical protein